MNHNIIHLYGFVMKKYLSVSDNESIYRMITKKFIVNRLSLEQIFLSNEWYQLYHIEIPIVILKCKRLPLEDILESKPNVLYVDHDILSNDNHFELHYMISSKSNNIITNILCPYALSGIDYEYISFSLIKPEKLLTLPVFVTDKGFNDCINIHK